MGFGSGKSKKKRSPYFFIEVAKIRKERRWLHLIEEEGQ